MEALRSSYRTMHCSTYPSMRHLMEFNSSSEKVSVANFNEIILA